MQRLTEPLALRLHLKETNLSLEWVPFLDALLIALCFGFLGSPFITAPGVELALPRVHHLDRNATVRVLTVAHNGMIIFEDQVLSLNEFKAQAKQNDDNANVTLLVKMGKDVSVQTLSAICDAARTSGYLKVQIAAEPEQSTNGHNR